MEGSEGGRVQVLADTDFSYAIAPEEKPQIVLPGSGFVYAPTVLGADAGFAYVLVEGNAVGKFPVVYGATVEQARDEQHSFWQKLRIR